MTAIKPMGDRAFLAHFETESEAASWALALRAARWPVVEEVVLAYDTAAVFAAPRCADLGRLEDRLRSFQTPASSLPTGNLVRIPVLYDGADLADVARALGRPESEVVALHHDLEYRVFAIGFRPGFPYAGYLPPGLSGLPRRTPPRVRVEPGSVAIVGRQTAIYPVASPGGWHLIGRTPLVIADPRMGRFPILAGDRLRFEAIEATEFDFRKGEPL